ncbi:hypothetical protein Back11_36570 [Paenibacillus baekrokdamisoli]|uniref:Uncharacterized protein n=1 Tax=Paenibacillus baekrokdamisoli TaxID=1712516 RepID=A0A3G9IVL4_9BACL|nr:hypothetical protein Back11_36570 [Paenibacillus baekrokdamisoli]
MDGFYEAAGLEDYKDTSRQTKATYDHRFIDRDFGKSFADRIDQDAGK